MRNGTLTKLLERDPRFQQDVNEYTLQALVHQHISHALGHGWKVTVEDFIPKTSMKADVVVTRLAANGSPDARVGAIAIEVKPGGGEKRLGPDIDKLKKYVRRASNAVNMGLLIYRSRRETDPAWVRKKVGLLSPKIAVIWVPKE